MTFSYRQIIGLVLIMLPILGLFYFYTTDISANGSFIPTCIFKSLSGLDCALCGTQRSMHSLLHGNIKEALQLNAFFIISLPMFIYMYFSFIREILTSKRSKKDIYLWYFLAFSGILFMILRNIL